MVEGYNYVVFMNMTPADQNIYILLTIFHFPFMVFVCKMCSLCSTKTIWFTDLEIVYNYDSSSVKMHMPSNTWSIKLEHFDQSHIKDTFRAAAFHYSQNPVALLINHHSNPKF